MTTKTRPEGWRMEEPPEAFNDQPFTTGIPEIDAMTEEQIAASLPDDIY